MNELEWLSKHPKEVEKYSGRWVAVTDKGIVVSGASAEEVESLLKKKGIVISEIMLMKLPRRDEEMSIL